MGKKLKTAYRFDGDGWYVGACLVQYIAVLKRYNLPDDCTEVAPGDDHKQYWYKFDEPSKTWTAHKKPTTAAECLSLGTISHQTQTPHDTEARALMQKLVDADSGYRIDRGDDLSWTAVKIPEKTADELALEQKEQARQEAQSNLARTDYVAAKIAEGAATKEEYADVLAQRQAWRNEINALDAEIETLSVSVAAVKEAQNV